MSNQEICLFSACPVFCVIHVKFSMLEKLPHKLSADEESRLFWFEADPHWLHVMAGSTEHLKRW